MKKSPNPKGLHGSIKRGAGNGAAALPSHIGRLERAVPDHERWPEA
jgi:hypothetical protein